MRRDLLELIGCGGLGIRAKVAWADHEQMPGRLGLVTEQICGVHFRIRTRSFTDHPTDLG
jgi:hypothetical protein